MLTALATFLGFDFNPHSIIPDTWNPEYPPPRVMNMRAFLRIGMLLNSEMKTIH